MPAAEPGPEWILLGVEPRSDSTTENELVKAARSAWPKALAHVGKEQSHDRYDDAALATEVWEDVLQSVSRTLKRMNGRRGEITDMEAYLLGTFYHRFSRALRKERRREKTIHVVSSVQELEVLGTPSHAGREHDIERTIHAQEILQRMDAWSRRVWVAREYGYSWKEIGYGLGIPGDSVMLRFRRRMKILGARLSGRR
jgi:DNA-directed RNA polymerase specialized sigma24 family protein